MPQQAPSITVEALSLKAYDYQEADRLVHVFTPTLGARTVIVKGARKPTSKLSGACEPLTLNQLEVFEGRQFDRLKGYRSLATFPDLRQDLARLSMAHVMADWLRCLCSESDPTDGRAAFDQTLYSLSVLDAQAVANVSNCRSLQQLLLGQIGLLGIAGYLPSLQETVDTSEPWDPEFAPVFSVEWGGLVANAAIAKEQGHTLIQLRRDSVLALQRLVERLTDPTSDLPDYPLELLLRLEKFLRFYVEHRLRHPLKSHEFMLACLR